MKNETWKTIAIIAVCIVVVETSYIGIGLYSYNQIVEQENFITECDMFCYQNYGKEYAFYWVGENFDICDCRNIDMKLIGSR